jgi:hypothetical protein
MKKDIGASAGFLALLALFVHTQIPTPENSGPPTRTSDTSGADQPKGQASGPVEVIDGPWLAVQAFFGASAASLGTLEPGRETNRNQTVEQYHNIAEKLTSPTGQLEPGLADKLLARKMAPARTDRWSIVATVADPAHTHMALSLDGQLEALERSVQARGWSFAGQWLPWSDHFGGNESDISKRRSQRWLQRHQEEMPGVLIFQTIAPGSRHALFVFVVPETVTGGINGPAFYAAMHLAELLSNGHPIGLLAPTFSGSFKNLSNLLVNLSASGPAVNIVPTIYGGAVSSLVAASDFVNQTSHTIPGLSFHGGVLDSHDYLEAFCYVLKKYHLDRRAAVLKEDEGGLQQTLGTTQASCEPQLQTYVFPREISSLRNASRDLPAPAAGNPYGDQPARLDFSIRDPTSGEDSIPTFSEGQTPLLQDTILSSITEELNRQHTHIVFISVTNPLDALFLRQVLRSACPDARVFIQGPDVLFVAAAAREPLDGTIFLSPYPMFFEGDDWLSPQLDASPHHDRMMFAESSLQGIYNVTQLLLDQMQAPPNFKPDLRGYGQPADANPVTHPYPGLWLLTLNRFGFLPVDLLTPQVSAIPDNSVGKQDKDWFQHNPTPGPALTRKLSPLAAPRSWLITVFIVSVMIFGLCFTFLRCNLSGRTVKPLWLVFTDNCIPRFEALLCACLSLSALQWFLASPLCVPWSSFFSIGRPRVNALKVAMTLGFALPLVTVFFSLCLLKTRNFRAELRLRGIVYIVMPIAVFLYATWTWYQLCDAPDTGLFFRFRALELYSGSSPVLPLAFACLAFLCIAVFHLKQYALAGTARPQLNIPLAGASAYKTKLLTKYESVENRIMSPWTLSPANLSYRVSVAVVFALTCLVILGTSSTSAFELPPYNQLLLIAIGTILLCLTTKWYDLLNLWLCVKRLLRLIQVLPLQSAIERVATNWPKRPIWAFSRSVSKNALQRAMIYALHRRAVSAKYLAGERNTGIVAIKAADKDLTDFRELVFGKPQASGSSAAEPSALQEITCRQNHEAVSARVAATIYDLELVPAWRLSLLDEADRDPEGQKTGNTAAPESWQAVHLQYCADFVALQFCNFIVYAVGQIQRIATSLSVTFVLLALLLNSYSPEARQLVARLLGVLFLGIGYVVWRVFSEMERNIILSAIAHTSPGQLGGEFWIQLITLGVLPLLGVLGHLFPSFSQFLSQWIAPSVQAMH